MISITVNGDARLAQPGATLAELVVALGASPLSLATAVNGEFIPREARAQCLLRDGDEVFTFQPITGG
jgi:sulfur carrier protein